MGVNTSPSYPKSPIPSPKSLDTFTMKSTASSSSATCMMKMKAVIQNFIVSHICRVVRALSKAKSILIELFKGNQLLYLKGQSNSYQFKKKKYRSNKVLFGSFRLHYNWCSTSAHILPMPPSPVAVCLDDINNGGISSSNSIYYDSTWNSVFSTDNINEENECCLNNAEKEKKKEVRHHDMQGLNLQDCDTYSQLSSYLQWLEEEKLNSKSSSEKKEKMNEIDMLADMFIKNSHEKFRLEKIESYRRYQEILARSM